MYKEGDLVKIVSLKDVCDSNLGRTPTIPLGTVVEVFRSTQKNPCAYEDGGKHFDVYFLYAGGQWWLPERCVELVFSV